MFYVNTTTKKFALPEPFQPSNSMPCGCGYCCEGTDVPLFLRTKVVPTSSIVKPYLTHYETAVFEIQFKDAQGVPYDLTDNALILAVDNTFSHSDSLVCLSSDIEITDPLNGIARFTVKCSSQKFGKLVAVKMPSAQIWMQITAYSRDDLQGTVLLLDRGIHLQPRLYTTQGQPEPLDPNYYTKQQIDILLLDYSNSIPLETIATKDDLRNLQQQVSDSLQAIRSTFNEYYTKEETDEKLLQISNSLISIRDSLGNYYTKSEVNGFIGELSNSIASVKSTFDNYYNKTEIDERFVEVCSNSFALYLQHRIDKVESDALVLQGHLQSEIDKKLDSPVIGIKGQFFRKGSNSNYWSDLPLEDYYKKPEVDAFIRELSNSIDAANARFDRYYTKSQIDNFNKNFSNSLAALKADFDNYYTKAQVDAIVAGLSDSADLANYYTKSQTDALLSTKQDLSDALQMKAFFQAELDTFSNSIAAIKDTFSNYYTKAETDELLSEFSNSDIEDLQNRVTVLENKPEVVVKGAGAVSVQSNSSLYTVSFSVDDNIFGIIGRLTSKLTMAKLQTPQQGFAATYQLQGADGSPIGDKINIIQDILLRSMDFIYATAQDVQSDSSVILNDPYLKVVCYVQQEAQPALYKTVYVPVKDLVDTYTAGNGLQLVDTQFSLRVDSDSQTLKYLSLTDKLGLRGIDAAISSAIQSALNSYYDKAYIDTALEALSNSIAAVNAKLGGYYTKAQTEELLQELSDSLAYVNSKFNDYYNKDYIDTLQSSLSDSIQAVRDSLGNYYNKTEVDGIAKGLSDSIERTNLRFDNYFTKEQVLQLIADHSGSGPVIDPYTAGNGLMLQSNTFYIEADEGEDTQKYLNIGEHSLGLTGIFQDIAAAQSNANNYTDGKLQDYYTKSQVDQIVANLSDSIDLSNYYTRGEVDAFVSALSDSIQAVKDTFGNYYTRAQVDELLAGLSNSYPAYVPFDTVDVSDARTYITFPFFRAPVGLLTEKGSYYPVQKASVVLDYSNSTVTVILDPYLAYEDDSSFTGTWLCFFANGGSDSIIQAQISGDNYYTKMQVDSLVSSLSDSIQAVKASLNSYYTKLQTDAFISALSNSIESVKIQLTQKLDVPPAGLPGDVLMLYSDSYGWNSLPLREVSDSSVGTIVLDRAHYGRWVLTGTGNISLSASNWSDGSRGQVIVDTSKQVISIPANWVVPDALWDAWTDTPGVYCLQMRKQGGVIYAHALVPFSAYQGSSQQIPVNLSARLQAVQQAVDYLSDSLSSLQARVTTVQGKVDALVDDQWVQIYPSPDMDIDPQDGSRQKVYPSSEDMSLTAPTLSYTYPKLTLQIAKDPYSSFTLGGITIQLTQTVLVSWYYDGSTTRRLPILFMGD